MRAVLIGSGTVLAIMALIRRREPMPSVDLICAIFAAICFGIASTY